MSLVDGRGGFDFGRVRGRAVAEAFGEAAFKRLFFEGGDHRVDEGRETGERNGARKTVGALDTLGI